MSVDYTSSSGHHGKAAKRNLPKAILRGLRHRCPQCGTGSVFARYLKIADICGHCGEELHHHQADDAPPYFTIFIVGHIIIPLVFLVETTWHPAMWIHMVTWLPLAVLLTLTLLPMVKGAVVGLQWALRMHGFEYSALCTPKSPAQGR